MDKDIKPTEYEIHNGLFGQTDRNSGEYHFKSGNVGQIYTNASYIPLEESATPPKYYKPSSNKSVNNQSPKSKAIKGLAAILGLCILCAIGGGVTGALIVNSSESKSGNYSNDLLLESEDISNESVTARNMSVDNNREPELSAKDIYSSCKPQVVCINVERYTLGLDDVQIPSNIAGTGFFISEDGYILTNYHVVEQAYKNNYPIDVTVSSGDTVNGVVVGFDSENDIAVIKINSGDCTTATLGDSDAIEIGEDIYLIGNPYGILDFSLVSGHVGGPARQVDSSDSGIPLSMFQLDAAIYEGNSGGPVYNSRGEVIGIVTAKFSSESTDGIGFAIPINNAKDIAEDIMANGYSGGKASLGVDYFEKYNSVMANFYEMPTGAYIMNVRPGSAADEAGLKRGDIIVQIGNIAVYDQYDCENIIGQYRAGDTENIVVFRDQMEYDYLSVTFDEAVS